MKKYVIDHICLASKDIEQTIKLFEEAFGMEIVKSVGDAPSRKIWFDGGIQVNEIQEFDPKGGMDHFALNVPENEKKEVFEKATAFGCTQVDGMEQYQWIRMPEGQIIELTDITEVLNGKK